jgi:hypothetical protein
MSCPSKTNAFPRRSNFPLTHVRRSSVPRLGVGLAFADMHCDVRDCTLPTRQPLGDSRRSDARRLCPSNGRMALHRSIVSSAAPRRLFCRRIHRSTRADADEGLIAHQSPRRIRSATNTIIGEKSSPPIGGSTLRIGAMAGSVRLYTSCTSGCRLSARTHDMTIAARTTSEYRSISVTMRRIETDEALLS